MGHPHHYTLVNHMAENYSPITREELKAIVEPLKEGVERCVLLLELQNSRIHKNETDMAVMKDRQPTRQAATWGAGAGASIAAFIALVDWLIEKF